MTSFDEINFKPLAQIYALSNTPYFLFRKLQEHSLVLDIAHSFSAEQILAEMRRLTATAPADAYSFVRPYAYLIALSKKGDLAALKAAVLIPNNERWSWYAYLGGILIETFVASNTQRIKVTTSEDPKPTTSTTPASWQEITVH